MKKLFRCVCRVEGVPKPSLSFQRQLQAGANMSQSSVVEFDSALSIGRPITFRIKLTTERSRNFEGALHKHAPHFECLYELSSRSRAHAAEDDRKRPGRPGWSP